MLDDARSFAVTAHGSQMYGARPYVFHLDAVVGLLTPYGVEAQIVGYLHDVVEDTAVTEDEVRKRFGHLVGECVSLLTDAPGANRAERKAGTYARLATVAGLRGTGTGGQGRRSPGQRPKLRRRPALRTLGGVPQRARRFQAGRLS
jgi:hypothetical protein